MEHSKLSLGMIVSVNGCSSTCALRLASNLFRVYPAYCSKKMDEYIYRIFKGN